VVKRDIETVMNEIADIMKANLQAKITEINTEKGDTLLSNFVAEAYFLWDSSSIPKYEVAFLQYMDSVATVQAEKQGALAINYRISIAVMFRDAKDAFFALRDTRYARVVREIIQEKIAPVFSNLEIMKVDPRLWESPNGVRCYVTITDISLTLFE